jgi:hypothetical protein
VAKAASNAKRTTRAEGRNWLQNNPTSESRNCVGSDLWDTSSSIAKAAGVRCHVIGGALEAGELDAKRAIDQAVRLAVGL